VQWSTACGATRSFVLDEGSRHGRSRKDARSANRRDQAGCCYRIPNIAPRGWHGRALPAANLEDRSETQIRRAEDIAPAFEAFTSRVQALYVAGDPLVNTNRIRINTLALGARLPTMHGFRELVETGDLMSYGHNYPDLIRRAAEFVDKILRGAKPADIPVEQPIRFDLVINLATAKAIGLTIPESLLLRADEVIE
jgi:ABC-type uncharacterized transport system substrate-binding protein